MIKNHIVIAIWLTDYEEEDECFFFHEDTDNAIVPSHLDFTFFNFDNESVIREKLEIDTYYSDNKWHKIGKAILTVEEFVNSKPFEW